MEHWLLESGHLPCWISSPSGVISLPAAGVLSLRPLGAGDNRKGMSVDLSIFHLRMGCSREVRDGVSRPGSRRHKIVREAFLKGYYEKVATVYPDGLDFGQSIAAAWLASQNGVLTDSWSRRPLPFIEPEGDGTVTYKGKVLGRRSTRVGDIIATADGSGFYVSERGFVKI